MFKKLLLLMALVVLATPSFASVGIHINNGGTVGTATDLNLPCDTGSTVTLDGSTYNVGCNANFVVTGVSNSGSTSLATTGLTVPTSYALVRKSIASAASGSFSAGTLANGSPGQQLTIEITAVGSAGTFVVTPTTSTGWTSITFNTYVSTNPQRATFLYVNNTVGWIILSMTGSTLPTVIDTAGQ